MHQLLLRLRVKRDCAHERRYHRKIRGRLIQTLEGTPHGAQDSSSAPFAFSEPLPYRPEHDEGDECHLVVSAPSVGALKAIASGLLDDPTMTAGSMLFDVRAAIPIETDVGPPGSSGTITTASGACIALDADKTYWSDRNHTEAEFREAFSDTVEHILHYETDLEWQDDPFDEYHHEKTFAVVLEVTPKNDLTIITSKWDFGYEVRDEKHRAVLNALLGTGVGAKRSYGFGCLQTRETGYRIEGRDGVMAGMAANG